MNMQRAYIWRPGRQMHSFRTQFLVLMSAGILAKLQPIIWSYILLGVFSYKFLQYFENTFFLEHLCTMASISLIENNSIVTTWDSLKNCLLACKISNQMHTNFEKRKVPHAASGNIVQKWLFCKTCVLRNICFFVCG